MQVHHLCRQHSILNRFVFELREVSIQKDRMRFRKNIERIGEILAFELSKKLAYTSKDATTPLGKKEMKLPDADVVICSVLRAGLPLHLGLLNFFDHADNGFISAYRKHLPGTNDFEIALNYLACPSLQDRTLLLCDPMLASGKTFETAFRALQSHGTPKEIHLVSLIGSTPGIAYLESVFPNQTQLWIADIDPVLNDKAYIVPGLGDAGDLAFGEKL